MIENETEKMSQQSEKTRSSNFVERTQLRIPSGVYTLVNSEMLNAGVFVENQSLWPIHSVHCDFDFWPCTSNSRISMILRWL